MDAPVPRSATRVAITLALLGALAATATQGVGCGAGSPPGSVGGGGVTSQGAPGVDVPDAGAPDAGTPDAGAPDAGAPDAGSPDAGSPDAGSPDAGTPDAGAPDAGSPDGGGTDGGFTPGQPGPWPLANQQYGAADGILESPVVATSTDEAQNLWVATHAAVYLLRPGDKAFRRFGSREGLHLADNPLLYREDYCGGERDVPGSATADGISTIVGGGPGEVLVGYFGIQAVAGDCTDPAVARHSGMLDRVRLQPDGTVQVKRLLMVATGMGMKFWHNRTVYRMVYDHVHHPHTLYVGTDHGVDMMYPDKFRDPLPGEWTGFSIQEWMSDHLHVQICFRDDPTCLAGGEGNARMGDWRGLAVDPGDGDLWHAGRWSAGKIRYTPLLTDWNMRPGQVAYSVAFGSGGSPPVFDVPDLGDVVSLSAVTVARDGTAWFASSWFYGTGAAVPGPGTGLGLAHYLGNGKFAYLAPGQAGLAEQDVQDLVALPDGRLVLAGAHSGLVFWDPATGAHTALHGGQGIPDDDVQQLELDTMVEPPALHVSTRTGAASLRAFPR